MLSHKAELVRPKHIPDVCDFTTRTAYRLAAQGKFPKPVKIGGVSGWRKADIDRFLAERSRVAGNSV